MGVVLTYANLDQLRIKGVLIRECVILNRKKSSWVGFSLFMLHLETTGDVKSQRECYPTQFSTRYDPHRNTLWCLLNPFPTPCINVNLLRELSLLQSRLKASYSQHNTLGKSIHSIVLASKNPDVFSLGGDLALFKRLIDAGDRVSLSHYARTCARLFYNNLVNLNLPIQMISLVRGKALGGGFEIALSSRTIIAERSARLGLPEVLFNQTPAMGAYPILAQRIGVIEAEKLILSGKTYSASELLDMGVIDQLVEDGEGILAVNEYVDKMSAARNSYRAVHSMRQLFAPVTLQNMLDMVEVWVEVALSLTRRDLAKMEKLLVLQASYSSNHSSSKQEWRAFSEWRATEPQKLSFPLVDHMGVQVISDRRKQIERRH